MRDYKYFTEDEQSKLRELEMAKDMETYRKLFLEYTNRPLDWNLFVRENVFGYFTESGDNTKYYGTLSEYTDGAFIDHNGIPYDNFYPIKTDPATDPFMYENRSKRLY